MHPNCFYLALIDIGSLVVSQLGGGTNLPPKSQVFSEEPQALMCYGVGMGMCVGLGTV